MMSPQCDVKTLVIGMSGIKGSGKDTAAEYMMRHFETLGIKSIRLAFADALKQECAGAMAPIIGIPYDELLAEFYDPELKKHHRELLQWWGSMRRRQDPPYWINVVDCKIVEAKAMGVEVIFIPDTRHINEINMITRHNGIMVIVERPGVPDDSTHSSEHEWRGYKNWVYCIHNKYDLDALDAKTLELAHIIKAQVFAYKNVEPRD